MHAKSKSKIIKIYIIILVSKVNEDTFKILLNVNIYCNNEIAAMTLTIIHADDMTIYYKYSVDFLGMF